MSRSKVLNHFTRLASMAALATLLAPATALAGDAAAGKTAYTTNCVSCHGETGKGDGPVGQVLPTPPRDFSVGDFKIDADGDGTTGTDADLKAVISKGAAAFDGDQMMAAWGGVLSDEDVDNVVAYIHTLKQ